MHRRHFTAHLALAFSIPLPALAASGDGAAPRIADTAWHAIEKSVAGLLGVAVLDTATGQLQGHRLDERFPMCSTFKWLLAALVLQRAQAGALALTQTVRYGRAVLIDHSPVTEQHAADGMTIAALCEATVTESDNAAANLLLQRVGGEAAVTRFARSLGDPVTRLDRSEPQLNEARPGDPRDTTSPRAMATTLRAALLGEALSPGGRAQLLAWLKASRTGDERLRAGVPRTWAVGDKTGTGGRGSTNDVAILMPPGRAPLLVAAYLTQTSATADARNAALAAVGRAVAAFVG